MRDRFFFLLLFLIIWRPPAFAADLVTATISVTTPPLGNTNSLTINGSTRTFTNDITASPGTLIQQTNSIPWSATNLLQHLTLYPVSTGHYLSQSTASNVMVRGRVGEVMTVTIAGLWASVTYSTQTVSSPTFVVRMPITVETGTNQTNIASLLASTLNLSTQALATNASALSNFLSKGASPAQVVAAPVIFSGSAGGKVSAFTNGTFYSNTMDVVRLTNVSGLHGSVKYLAGGLYSNLIAHSITTTNLVNYGNAISSPGTNGASEQFGTSALSAGLESTAIGASCFVFGHAGTALGYIAAIEQTATNAIAIGRGANVDVDAFLDAMALGTSAYVDAPRAIALGASAAVLPTHQNSIVIGPNSSSTASNQVRLGASLHTVSIPGWLNVEGVITNSAHAGTNRWLGDMSFLSSSISSVANGRNTLNVGTNVYVRLTGAPSTGWTLSGLTGGNRDGKFLWLENATGQDVTIQNEDGIEPTAANRILTYATAGGTNVTLTGNGMMGFIYAGSLSRWILITPFGDQTVSVTNLNVASGYLATNTASFFSTNNLLIDGGYWTNNLGGRVLVTVNGLLTASTVSGAPSLCVTNITSGQAFNFTNSLALNVVMSSSASFLVGTNEYVVVTNKSTGSASAALISSFARIQ